MYYAFATFIFSFYCIPKSAIIHIKVHIQCERSVS